MSAPSLDVLAIQLQQIQQQIIAVQAHYAGHARHMLTSHWAELQAHLAYCGTSVHNATAVASKIATRHAVAEAGGNIGIRVECWGAA